MSDPSRAIFVQDLIPFHTLSSLCVLQFLLIPVWAGAVSLDRWNDGKCTLLIPLGPKKKKIAAAFSLHTTHKHFFLYDGGGFAGRRRRRGSAESCSVVLGGTNAQQRSRRNERDHLKFMRAKWYSRLHPAPLVAFIAGAGTELERGRRGETKPPEMGSHSYSGAVAVAVRCRSELPGSPLPPSLSPPTFPLGKWGVITKTLGRAGVSFCHRCL